MNRMKVYYCPQCSAKLVIEKYPTEQWCPYCEVVYRVPPNTDKDAIYKNVRWTVKD